MVLEILGIFDIRLPIEVGLFVFSNQSAFVSQLLRQARSFVAQYKAPMCPAHFGFGTGIIQASQGDVEAGRPRNWATFMLCLLCILYPKIHIAIITVLQTDGTIGLTPHQHSPTFQHRIAS